MIARAVCLAALLSVAPLAQADDEACRIDLGRGWPPATETYGAAVEQLFAAGVTPALTLTRLPARSAESSLQLLAGEGEGDWTLRWSRADERVEVWRNGRRELRVQQQPDVASAPMPAALARRVVADWQRVLSAQVPAERAAEFHEGEVLLFVVDGLRVSGLQPACGPVAELMRQLDLMADAADQDEEDRAELWVELGRSLDQLEQSLAGGAG